MEGLSGEAVKLTVLALFDHEVVFLTMPEHNRVLRQSLGLGSFRGYRQEEAGGRGEQMACILRFMQEPVSYTHLDVYKRQS